MATLDNSTNTCRSCNAEKPIGEFYLTKGRFGRLYADNTCKACRSAKSQDSKARATIDTAEAERRRIWRREHKRKLRAERGCKPRASITADAAVRVEAKARQRAEKALLRRDANAHVKRWREVLRVRALSRAKWATPKGCLDGRMRVSIGKALRGAKAGRKWESLVGYTLTDLMQHIERQFTKGMGWHNMGEWHIDHRVPRAAFNYHSSDCQAFKDCWSLTNLQPLWAADNLAKRDAVCLLV